MKYSGEIGWLLLAAYIVAFDYYVIKRGHTTLSACANERTKHPVNRAIAVAVWLVIGKHLFFRGDGWL